jgi:hypothetical protein
MMAFMPKELERPSSIPSAEIKTNPENGFSFSSFKLGDLVLLECMGTGGIRCHLGFTIQTVEEPTQKTQSPEVLVGIDVNTGQTPLRRGSLYYLGISTPQRNNFSYGTEGIVARNRYQIMIPETRKEKIVRTSWIVDGEITRDQQKFKMFD